MSQEPLTVWSENLLAAANEFVVNALEWERGEFVEDRTLLPSNMVTSCIAMVGEESTIQMGISLTHEDAVVLVNAMLGLTAEDGDPTAADIADALGEVANVMAGSLKTRVQGMSSGLALGLPIVLHGRIEPPADTEVCVTVVRWGSVEGQLFLLRKRL